MADAAAFSPDYLASRARFRGAALALGWRTDAWALHAEGPDGDPLTIDVAMIGDERPKRAVVVSSGLHGVEGFLGGAIQAALLEDVFGGFVPPAGTALVMLHALNPYGMAYLRRVNEDNVDLNRNFLVQGESFGGSPGAYAALDGLLNPPRAPRPLSLFKVKAAAQIARYGLTSLKQAVAGGQYDYPLGLFYGGSGPTMTQRILRVQIPALFRDAERVVHVDFHSGLGKPASYKLLVDHARGTPGADALAAAFGADVVEPWEPEQGVSYAIRGGMGAWCKSIVPQCNYDVLAAEFGTVGILDVIEALHRENRAHHWAPSDAAVTRLAKSRLKDVFAPPDRAWRDTIVQRGVHVAQQAIDAVF